MRANTKMLCSIVAALACGSAAQAASWTVTGLGEPALPDSAQCNASAATCPTLRDAINRAAHGDTITFDPGLDGQTITLTLAGNAIDNGQFGPSAFYLRDKSITIDASHGLSSGIVLERQRYSSEAGALRTRPARPSACSTSAPAAA